MNRQTKGFTLIELMLVIAVLGIIAAIAYPSFIGQIQKARRADAKQSLLDVAAKLEVFYQDNKGYPVGAALSDRNVVDLGYNDDDGDGEGADGDFHSLEGYYAISTIGNATSFTIQAIPIGTQVSETDCDLDPDKPPCCGTYALNHLGEKSISADATLSVDRCW